MQQQEEVKLKVIQMFGVIKPYLQGNSWKLNIPREVVEKYKLEERYKQTEHGREYLGFICLDTDKGIFLIPLTKSVSESLIKKVLTQFVDISSITEDELKILIERLSEQNNETQP